MEELDEVWTNFLKEAAIRTKSNGGNDVADYLALKSTNDFLRSTSIGWLFESVAEIASEANRNKANLTFEKKHPHEFTLGNANLVGWLVRFRQGVRCLSAEAGWTRTPSDGFMRGGALAVGRVTHFGMSKKNAELILLKIENAPVWFALDKHGQRSEFHSNHLQNHFKIFLDAA
ncbi:MAG: hypothetical protein ACR2F2_02435 [Pyrinomonadaceae bacterium]